MGCCLWGRTESDTTEATQQQQQQQCLFPLLGERQLVDTELIILSLLITLSAKPPLSL